MIVVVRTSHNDDAEIAIQGTTIIIITTNASTCIIGLIVGEPTSTEGRCPSGAMEQVE